MKSTTTNEFKNPPRKWRYFFRRSGKVHLGRLRDSPQCTLEKRKGQNHTCSLFLSIYPLQDFAFRDIIIPTGQDFEGEKTGRHELRIQELYQNIHYRMSLGQHRAVCQADGSAGLLTVLYQLSPAVVRHRCAGRHDGDL